MSENKIYNLGDTLKIIINDTEIVMTCGSYSEDKHLDIIRKRYAFSDESRCLCLSFTQEEKIHD